MTDGTSPARVRTSLPAGVWVLGFVSLLMDVSSEMVHSLLPLFMVGTLGVSVLAVGVIEGIAESTALISKVFSGALGDHLGRRKGLAVLGYAMGALSKPVFALAGGVGAVVAARFVDRVGKGLRGAPRDALLADITPPAVRGAAFGLRQSLDTVGAFVGPPLATALMLLWANDFRAVFWVAVVPGLMAVVLLMVGVALWGMHMGMTQGLLAAMVAATAPADLRGTAFGFFNLLCGVAMLLSSVVAGLLWDRLGSAYTFVAGAGFALLTLAGLLVFRPRHRSPAAA